MKRALIFDFGGVLMKTIDYTPRFQWDDRLKLARGSVERIVHGSESWKMAQTGTLSIEDYWQDVARQFTIDTVDLARLQRDFFSGDRLDETLVAHIREWKSQGYPVALLSNDSPVLLDKLNQLGIATLFDPLVISAQIGAMKPAPQAYQSVLDGLGLPADKTIFIDDNADNINGAKMLGIHTIHYTPEIDLPTLLKPLLNTD